MRRAAHSDGCGRCLAGVFLEPGDQLVEVVCRKIFARGDEDRAIGQQRYRFKILEHVVLDRIDGARAHVAQPIADAQRIAVRRRACRTGDADAAAGAGDILDHHGLAELSREIIGKDSRDGVGDAAGRHRHDDGDGTGRINLRAGKSRKDRQRGSARSET